METEVQGRGAQESTAEIGLQVLPHFTVYWTKLQRETIEQQGTGKLTQS